MGHGQVRFAQLLTSRFGFLIGTNASKLLHCHGGNLALPPNKEMIIAEDLVHL